MRLRVCLLGMLSAAAAWAQGGSNYSLFGIGDVRPAVGALYDGCASAGVALVSEHGISTLNPALWSHVRSTRLQGGYRFNQQQIWGDAGRTAQNNGKVEGILGVFAIDTLRGWSAGFGLFPYSSVNAAVAVPVRAVLGSDTITGSYRVLASGGITVASVGVATTPIPRLAIGAAFRYYFGLFQSELQLIPDDSWSVPALQEQRDWLSGVGFALGLSSWLLEPLHIGVAVMPSVRLQTQRRFTHPFPHTGGDTTLEASQQWELPAAYAFGIGYRRNRWQFLGEYFRQELQWLSYRSDPRVQSRALQRWSFGVVRQPHLRGAHAWSERVGFAIGAGYQELYYRVSGVPIAEYFLSAGLSLPLEQLTLLEVACQSGIRGERRPGLLREWFARFSFSVSLGEQWFQPGRRRSGQ